MFGCEWVVHWLDELFLEPFVFNKRLRLGKLSNKTEKNQTTQNISGDIDETRKRAEI